MRNKAIELTWAEVQVVVLLALSDDSAPSSIVTMRGFLQIWGCRVSLVDKFTNLVAEALGKQNPWVWASSGWWWCVVRY